MHFMYLVPMGSIIWSRLLLVSARDIDPDQQDQEGRTPLNWAAEYGHTEIVKALLCDG